MGWEQWVYGNSVLSTQFQCEPKTALKIVCSKKNGKELFFFFKRGIFFPKVKKKKSVINKTRGPWGCGSVCNPPFLEGRHQGERGSPWAPDPAKTSPRSSRPEGCFDS